MQFEVLSHAGLAITSGQVQLVCDPWIIGSTYWRSWWNYPPPPADLPGRLKPTHIYLTHIHWDHFQAVTLRRFPRSTPILIPKAPSPRLLGEVHGVGFQTVVELEHGRTVELAPGVRVTSYHFSPFIDSALLIEAEGTTILNANDAKLMGGPLRQLLKRHPRIDFVLRSHSSANSRLSYSIVDDPRRPVDDAARYVEDFAAFVSAVGARVAIPFASNHCHLHREVWDYNPLITTPLMVKEHFDRRGIREPEVVVMLAGDSWSSDSGFQIAPNDYFTQRTMHLERYRQQQAGALERQEHIEAAATIDWPVVIAYFARLRRSTPWLLRRRFRNKPVLYVLRAGDRPLESIQVDLYAGTVRRLDGDAVADHPRQIHTSVHIFMHCVTSDLFSHLAISKRVQYRVRTDTQRDMEQWNMLFNLYEYDLIPLRRLVSTRFIACWLRRWRELILYATIVGNRLRGRPFEFADYLPIDAAAARGLTRRDPARLAGRSG